MCHSIHTLAALFIRKRIGKIALLIYDNRFSHGTTSAKRVENQSNRTKSSVRFGCQHSHLFSIILATDLFFAIQKLIFLTFFELDIFVCLSHFQTEEQLSHPSTQNPAIIFRTE